MGGIFARQLSLNHTKGPIIGGIYASCLDEHFEIPIRHEEKEETALPHAYLHYKSMITRGFLIKSREGELKYKLYFDKHHPETIICLVLLCLTYLQVLTSFHGRPFKPIGILHQPRNRSHKMSPHDYLFILGI